MWSWYDVVTPWDVKQYCYCPAIPWIARNYGVREPPTYSMSLGREERKKRLSRLVERGLEPPIRLDVQMYCPSLRLAGVADAIAGRKRLTVVEVKAFRRKKFDHFKGQLMAYALLCNRCVGPAYRALLVLGDRARWWDVTAEALEWAERLVAKVREVLASERPPAVHQGPKCASCWYARLCPSA